MVVDDEPQLQQLVRQKFRKEIRDKEYEFVFAENGVEAIEKLQSNGDIDLLLTDINMPKMNGLTLLTKLNELDLLIKSVIISAYGDMKNIRTAMNLGAFDFVTKPINLTDLELTINKCLKELEILKEAISSRDQLAALQRELHIATEIQTSILPQTFPAFPDRKEFDIFAKMITANEVGGDFYDFFLLDEHRIGFAIGDVSGKGVPAAILMATSRSFLKATAVKGVSTDACLRAVNNILVDESLPTMFVTLFYGILDTRSGALEYCNGGHNPPYLVSRKGRVEQLENVGGLLLGGVKDIEYQSKTVNLYPGDTLFLYTDGVTEAENEREDEFATDRLEDCLKRHCQLQLTEITEKVIEEVQAFSAGLPQTDDITCLALRYLSK
jgi:sigma-B regulation protein RsbU (phosphoserine phosphatase)